MPATLSEKLQADRFKQWFFEQTKICYAITDGPNPPDFLLDSSTHKTWLEVTDIYLNDDQAEFLNSPKRRSYSFHGSPDEIALRLLNQLSQKLSKASYQRIFEQRGKGTLLLTCEDLMFDEVNLARVHESFPFSPLGDRGFFERAYFAYRLSRDPDRPEIYELVYPSVVANSSSAQRRS
jgi:hypothetical protein